MAGLTDPYYNSGSAFDPRTGKPKPVSTQNASGYYDVPTTPRFSSPMQELTGKPNITHQISPTYTTDPSTGAVDRFDPVTGTWSMVGDGGGGASARRASAGGGGAGGGFGESLGPRSLQALSELYQPTTPLPEAPGAYQAPARPITPQQETAAEGASLTDARERGGRRAQAALRTLAGLDAASGRFGSRLEHADQRAILESDLSGMNDTERALLENRANRNASISDQDFQAADAAGRLTYGTQSAFPMDKYRAQIADKQRIASLLSQFGYVY